MVIIEPALAVFFSVGSVGAGGIGGTGVGVGGTGVGTSSSNFFSIFLI